MLCTRALVPSCGGGKKTQTYKIIAKDVYSAQAGNANFYIDGEYSELHSCRTDGGRYGLFVAKQGFGLQVANCHFVSRATVGLGCDYWHC